MATCKHCGSSKLTERPCPHDHTIKRTKTLRAWTAFPKWNLGIYRVPQRGDSMSRLATAIEAVRGEDRRIWPAPFGITVRQQSERLECATAYEVRALFAARVFVRDPQAIKPEQIRDAKRHILEEVFGEFRRPINQIHAALDELDIDRARDLLDELAARMFEPSPAVDAVDPSAGSTGNQSTRD